MIDWNKIETVLLDMDGTLLDLNFDNYFWQEHVTQRYAEKHAMDYSSAKTHLQNVFRKQEGTLEWYCIDYWSQKLGLDIAQLKAEVDHLIAIHPHVIDFLDRLRATGKQSVLVTNAHYKSLMLKLDRTALHNHLDHVVCAHDFGLPKEDVNFWGRLQKRIAFPPERTLLVDDSLAVLRSAQSYGIAYVFAVYKPDSCTAIKDVGEFKAINDFSDIMP